MPKAGRGTVGRAAARKVSQNRRGRPCPTDRGQEGPLCGFGRMNEAARETIRVRAAANKWISDRFPNERRFLGHAPPVRVDEGWRVALPAWPGKQRVCVGHLAVEGERAMLMDGSCAAISDRLAGCLEAQPVPDVEGAVKAGRL